MEEKKKYAREFVLNLTEEEMEEFTLTLDRKPYFTAVNEFIIKKVDEGKYNPSRGDVFCFKSFSDRKKDYEHNVGTFIWNYNKIEKLSRYIDFSFGNVPFWFEVSDTEFSPDWWSKTIGHNSIFWLDMSIQKKMHFKIINSSETTTTIYTDPFTIGDKKWICYIDNVYFNCKLFEEHGKNIYTSLKTIDDLIFVRGRFRYYFELDKSECDCNDLMGCDGIMFLKWIPEHSVVRDFDNNI